MNVAAFALAAALAVGAPTATEPAGEPASGAALEAAAVAADAAPDCTVTDAAITWGFKETFRSYISGTIANGEWKVADGATYETPDFGWSGGVGTLSDGVGTLDFVGSIEFTGHGGILDTTVANPRLVFDGSDRALLLLDVSGTTQQGAPIDERAVEFATIDVAGASYGDGTVTLADAPTVLTEQGSVAFGTYPAGEALDPITVALTADPACTVAPARGLGGAGLVWLIVASVLAVTVILLEIMRRRRRARHPRPAEAHTPEAHTPGA